MHGTYRSSETYPVSLSYPRVKEGEGILHGSHFEECSIVLHFGDRFPNENCWLSHRGLEQGSK